MDADGDRIDAGAGAPVMSVGEGSLSVAKGTLRVDSKGKIQIRLVTQYADAARLIPLGAAQHAESVYRDLAYDPDKLDRQAQRWFGDGSDPKRRPCLIVAEMGATPVGYLLGHVGRHWFSDTLAANMQTWFVLPEWRGSTAAIRLIRGFESWARQQGAATLHMNMAGGVRMAAADRMLRRMGFRQVGGSYVSSRYGCGRNTK